MSYATIKIEYKFYFYCHLNAIINRLIP
ncbi:hypothetical protein HORM4_750051 [Vibrio harveyi]|nr:hypothetical protein HORM4_750051 [Vibrio harveyi]